MHSCFDISGISLHGCRVQLDIHEDKTLKSDHSNESSRAVPSGGTVCQAV